MKMQNETAFFIWKITTELIKTTILALMPFLFGSGLGVALQHPLALTVIGGLAPGTLVSLYFIPVAYGRLYRKTRNLEE